MRIHFIEKDNYMIAYFPESKRFFKINTKTKTLINYIIEGKNNDFICENLNISKIELLDFKNKLQKYAEKIKPQFNLSSNKKILNRLVIHVTNKCNLRCKYCYANGGTYHSEESLLTKEQLDLILERFYNEFDIIEGIQLFGGEPLIDLSMIEYICNQINKFNKEKNLNTNIGLITNGTLINDKFIELVKKFNLHVTVSYDGNKKINDILRVYPNNLGTSDTIIKNILKLKEKTNQPEVIEATYTQYHFDNNITVLDIIKHINELFPNTYLHLVPAAGSNDCDYLLKNLEAFTDIKSIFDKNIADNKNEYSYSLIQRFINSLVNKEYGNDYICSAGVGTLSVSVNGDIYPCFMFTDMDDVVLGNVSNPNVFKSLNYISRLQKMQNFNFKYTNKKCKNCFINTLCTSCLGTNLLNCGDIYKLDNKNCEMFKSMASNIIIELAKTTDTLKEVN